MAVPTSASRMLPHVGQPVLPAVGDVQMTIAMKMYQDDTFTTPVDGTVSMHACSVRAPLSLSYLNYLPAIGRFRESCLHE